jgi:hypothetical protein
LIIEAAFGEVVYSFEDGFPLTMPSGNDGLVCGKVLTSDKPGVMCHRPVFRGSRKSFAKNLTDNRTNMTAFDKFWNALPNRTYALSFAYPLELRVFTDMLSDGWHYVRVVNDYALQRFSGFVTAHIIFFYYLGMMLILLRLAWRLKDDLPFRWIDGLGKFGFCKRIRDWFGAWRLTPETLCFVPYRDVEGNVLYDTQGPYILCEAEGLKVRAPAIDSVLVAARNRATVLEHGLESAQPFSGVSIDKWTETSVVSLWIEDHCVGMGSRVKLEDGTTGLLTAMHVWELLSSTLCPKLMFRGRSVCVDPESEIVVGSVDADFAVINIPNRFWSVLGVSAKPFMALPKEGARTYARVYGPGVGDKIASSAGFVEPQPGFKFFHNASTQKGWSGSPLITTTGKIVGVHCGHDTADPRGRNRGRYVAGFLSSMESFNFGFSDNYYAEGNPESDYEELAYSVRGTKRQLRHAKETGNFWTDPTLMSETRLKGRPWHEMAEDDEELGTVVFNASRYDPGIEMNPNPQTSLKMQQVHQVLADSDAAQQAEALAEAEANAAGQPALDTRLTRAQRVASLQQSRSGARSLSPTRSGGAGGGLSNTELLDQRMRQGNGKGLPAAPGEPFQQLSEQATTGGGPRTEKVTQKVLEQPATQPAVLPTPEEPSKPAKKRRRRRKPSKKSQDTHGPSEVPQQNSKVSDNKQPRGPTAKTHGGKPDSALNTRVQQSISPGPEAVKELQASVDRLATALLQSKPENLADNNSREARLFRYGLDLVALSRKLLGFSMRLCLK